MPLHLLEAQNKVMAVLRVTVLGPRLGAAAPDLPAAVHRAVLKGCRAPWLLEGIGILHTRRRLDVGAEADFLQDRPAEALSQPVLVMLHTGLGLALSRHQLERLPPGAGASEVQDRLANLIASCRRASRSGFEAATLEAVGLVARCFFPRHFTSLAAGIAALGADAARLFWLGAGRGLYFERRDPWPGNAAVARALARLAALTLPAAASANAVAGFCLALVLVNMASPAVVSQRLVAATQAGAPVALAAEGLAAALRVGLQLAPDCPWPRRLLRFEPNERALRPTWEVLRAEAVAGLGALSGHPEQPLHELHALFGAVPAAAELAALVTKQSSAPFCPRLPGA